MKNCKVCEGRGTTGTAYENDVCVQVVCKRCKGSGIEPYRDIMWRCYDGPYDISYAKEIGWIEAKTKEEALAIAKIRWPKADVQISNGEEFDPEPIENHMIHWPMRAEKFKDAPGELGIVARMLGYSLEESERLRKMMRKTDSKYTALFFAFIETVDRLPLWARWAVVTPKVDDSASSVGNAFKSIRQINEWRATNKHNIKEWDD